MGLGSIEINSVDQLIEDHCPESYDVKQAMVYTGHYQSNMNFQLGRDFEEVELEEESSLDEAWLNDATKEMILINGENLRVYRYRNKEIYKTDARILRTQSDRIKTRG